MMGIVAEQREGQKEGELIADQFASGLSVDEPNRSCSSNAFASLGRSISKTLLPVWISISLSITFFLCLRTIFSGEVKNESIVTVVLQCLATVFIYVAASSISRRAQGRHRGDIAYREFIIPPTFFILAFGSLAAISFTFRHSIYSGDEGAYLFQAKIFASGARSITAPLREDLKGFLFFTHHIISDGNWFVKYPPGWPLVLALFTFADLEWLASPLLAVVILALTYNVAKRAFNPVVAALAVLLELTSPFFLISSHGLFSHTLSAVLTLLILHLVLFTSARGKAGVLVGALIGVLFLVRPFTAALVGVAVLISVLRKEGMLAVPAKTAVNVMLSWTIGVAPFVAIYLIYNRILTGSWVTSTYALYRGLSYSPEISLRPSDLLNNMLTFTRWGIQELVVASNPLIFFPVLLAVCSKDKNTRAQILPFLTISALLVLGHLVQTEGSFSEAGERYYYEGFPALCVAVAFCISRRFNPQKFSSGAFWLISLSLAGIQLASYSILFQRSYSSRRHSQQAYEIAKEREAASPILFINMDNPEHKFSFNFNDPAALASGSLKITDPGLEKRHELACLMGLEQTTLIQLQSGERQIHIIEERWDCGAASKRAL